MIRDKITTMKTIKQIAEEIQNTSPYENLHSLLGYEMGNLIYDIVKEAKVVDHELDLLHDAMGELYEQDSSYEVVKRCLRRIDKLRGIK